jgi:hypothetical protein
MREHPLEWLEGELGGGFRMQVKWKKLKKAEQSFFQLFLLNNLGERSQNSVFDGLYSLGIEPYIDGWIDGHYYEDVLFERDRLDLSAMGLDLVLFKKLGSTLKPSWSFMVAYETFGDSGRTLRETSQCLNCGIPPITTPLGYLLFSTGRLKIKDWYFPEGGNEGMPKLEGIGAVDREHSARMRKETAKELKLFLRKGACSDRELEMPARKRAERILQEIRNRV